MGRITLVAAAIALAAAPIALSGCASAGGAENWADPGYDFLGVRSVYLETPIRLTIRGEAGAGNRDLEHLVEDELRAFFRRELHWAAAQGPGEADLIASVELTAWESGANGSRVGAAVHLRSAAGDALVLRANAVYPNRFGAGAQGEPRALLPDLFRRLFEGTRDP